MTRGKSFWNKEYKKPEHLAISTEPSEDLEKFTRWLSRQKTDFTLNKFSTVVDLGCGNGRNIIFLAKEFFVSGIAYDISKEAVEQAKNTAQDLPISFEVRSVSQPIPLESGSADLVLDMMVSHVLREKEREFLLSEIVRVLKPGSFLFFKSFLLDEDMNAKRMLKDYPADEQYAYIHPTIGEYEHVWTEELAKQFFAPYFEIRKIEKSHKHVYHGRAWKRRSIVMYLEKKY